MFVVSVHNFKIFEQIRSNAEYNRRAAIIEGLSVCRPKLFFEYPRTTVYDITKYLVSETSEKINPTRKSPSKEKSIRTPTIIESSFQELISEDSGLSLTKLAKILDVSDITMRRIAEEDLRFKSYMVKFRTNAFRGSKLARLIRKCFGPRNSGLRTIQI